ncbi:MAG: hypothetical protein ACYDCM_02640 [Candidatus Acidiferrales bacterium]
MKRTTLVITCAVALIVGTRTVGASASHSTTESTIATGSAASARLTRLTVTALYLLLF